MTDEEMMEAVKRVDNLQGMAVNEQLFNAGLMKEFDWAKKHDKQKARRILQLIEVDEPSIDKILQPIIVQVFKAIFLKKTKK